MPTLAVVSNLYPPHVLGGYEILCRQVVNALHGRGWKVRVLTSEHGESGEGVVDSVPVSRRLELFLPFGKPAVIDRGHRAKVTRRNIEITRRWLDEDRPDAVFIWSLLRATVGPARAAQASGIPTAWTFNDANIASYAGAGWRRPHRAIADLLHSVGTLRGVRLVPATCISECVRQEISDRLGKDLAATVIHQGVPVEEFTPKDRPGERHEPFRVLYAGQLHDYKGVHDAVEAMRSVPGATLTIAGSGDEAYTERLRAMGGPVRFLGKLDRTALVEEYRLANALVFPSVWKEPFGLTHLEAMAVGTPVVSTANGGQGEFLVDGENALVVPPSDPAAIAAALRRLMENDALRERLALSGLALSRSHYRLDRYVDDLESWIRREVLP